MKRLLAILLVALMLVSVSVPFASAQDTSIAHIGTNTEEARAYLETLLDSAVEILTSPDINTYTEESCGALEQAVGEGYGVYSDPDATAEELAIQADKVKNAINNMKKKTVSEDAVNYLSVAIAEAESAVGDEKDYTPESWATYREVLINALRVREESNSDEECIAAANALKVAMNSLVPVSTNTDKAREYLYTMMTSAYKILDSDVRYTARSLERLENAVDAANKVYSNNSASEQELYEEAYNIKDAIASMRKIVISEEAYGNLNDMLALADEQVGKEADYTPDSWSVYINAYHEALRILNTGESDEEYTTAANNLDNAIKGLVPVDKGVIEARAYLQTVISSAYKMLQGTEKYKEESVKSLKDAVNTANAVYLNENATQQELNNEADKLENVMASMEKIVISEQAQNSLLEEIAFADNTVGTEYEYTQDSWNAFLTAYRNAVEILDKGESDKEYTDAAKALSDAVNSLVKSSAGKDKALEMLYSAMNSAMDIMDDGQRYTAKSYDSLEASIISASQVYADKNATEQEIYSEIYNLESAMNSMVKVEISKEASDYLADAMAKAELIVKSDDEYKPESLSAFDKAYREAGRVFTKGESDEEYTAAADALNSAIDNLQVVEVPTVPANVISALMKAITSANTEVDLSLNYTPESLKEFNDAKAVATDVYNNSKSEEEFVQATVRLLAAIENLQIATVNILLGDVDKDGKVTIKDATLIQKTVAGITTLDERSTLAADSNRDDVVNVRDATEIQKSIAGLKSCEDIGKEIQIPVNGSPGEEIPKDETPDEENPDIQIPDEPYSIDYTIAYEFRVGPYEGGWENINLIVRSPQELQAVIDKMDYDYYYRNEDIFPEAYDEAFFEENAVIVSLYLVGGSECSQWIFSATVDGTFLILDRAVFRPEIYPPDMNYQCMYIEVKKADIHHITQVVDYKDLFPNGA